MQQNQPPIPANEDERLAALLRYHVLDTPLEQQFDDIAKLASHICDVPIALISLVDRDRQWIKARVGIELTHIPRDSSMSQYAIMQPGLTIVPDMREDPRFRDNPLVTGSPHMRFYMGAPLQTPSGLRVGALSIVDTKPRELTEQQKTAVEMLANQVIALLELRVAQHDAAEAAERINLALDSGTIVGTWVWDIPEDRVTGDERFARTFGFDVDRIKAGVRLGDAVTSIHPDDVDAVNAAIAESLRVGGQFRKEYRVRVAGDNWLWIEASGRVETNAAGEAVRFPGVLIDIDERKRTELALATTSQRYRLLFDAIHQGFCVIRMLYRDGKPYDYIFEEINPSFEQQAGIADGVGKNVRSIFPDLEQHWFDLYGGVADTGEHVRITEYNASVGRWYDVSAYRIGNPEECRVAVLFDDISERIAASETLKASQAAAESANVAKTEFLANMSHEIRTPMNAIIGLSSILASSKPLSEKQQQFVKTLQLSADALLALINDLLDISKVEARTVELEQIPFSITQLMQEVISMLAVQVKEKQLAFTIEGEDVHNRIYIGDPHRLRQVILNLCGNAVKFTESGTVHVALTSRPTDREGIEDICIAVHDTGIGIAPEKLGNIFDKFVQADASINRKYGGTGLGLAITKTIVEIMGGTIAVESTPERGSIFTVCLPLRRSADAPPGAGESLASLAGRTLAHRPRLLLVEDHAPNVLVATAVLDEFGYEVDVASNGSEAVSMVGQAPYLAVLMDVQMHGMNGHDATRAIREQEQREGRTRIPIIGMTAHALKGDRERCIDAGMDDYIAKPFNIEELREKLEAAIEAA